MSNPHDKLFRRIFDQPARAAELLQTALPTTLVAGLDWATLKRIPETFLDAELHEHHADLLFEARAGDCDVLVYLLLEHKSAPDPLTPFQILRYIVRIWEEWRRHNQGSNRLPPIIPLVVHHGPHPSPPRPQPEVAASSLCADQRGLGRFTSRGPPVSDLRTHGTDPDGCPSASPWRAWTRTWRQPCSACSPSSKC